MLKKVLITVALSALLGACVTRGGDPIPDQADQLAALSGQPATTTATTQKKEDDSFLAGLTALSTDDNGRLSPTLIGDWLRLIERVFSALNATLNLANRV